MNLEEKWVGNTKQVLDWINGYEKEANLVVERIDFAHSKEWAFSEGKRGLKHKTNGFFSIIGLKFQSNFYGNQVFEQPIINQPEIGILGFLAKMQGGELFLLAQAKTEPGNVNIVQLAPTLQATESNYKALHGGTTPLYLEYFLKADLYTVLVDQLQSEQGTRFLKKRNRNMVVLLPETIDLEETIHHKWISLSIWKELMSKDHLVNTDSRSVIASLVYSNNRLLTNLFSTTDFGQSIKESLHTNGSSIHFTNLISWITKLKAHYTLQTEIIPLSSLSDWKITNQEISHKSGAYFSVYQYKVHCQSREVYLWDQPLICTHDQGFLGLICKNINGVLHFLLQARIEPGHFDKIELTSSIHISLGEQESKHVLFMDILKSGTVIIEGIDSEEGGRFYRDENDYKIVQVYEDIKLPLNYKWVTLNQIRTLILFNNFLTNELRSLLALMYSRF